jgi:hypothetical protein
MYLPSAGTTFNCGSITVKRSASILWNPLNTDNMQINAAVAMATPHSEIPEMMLITLCDFFDRRYLRAM